MCRFVRLSVWLFACLRDCVSVCSFVVLCVMVAVCVIGCCAVVLL